MGKGRRDMKLLIFGCLFAGFLLLFRWFRWLEVIRELMKQTRETMDEAARQRMLQSRKFLQNMEKESSLWLYVEQELQYSGLKRSFPGLTAEKWVVGNILGVSLTFLVSGMLVEEWWMACLCCVGVLFLERGIILFLKLRMVQQVERNLLKFLDFLGNYSITSGEITSVFRQVARYMEEPLSSVLDQCCYEAQITGDVGMALLSMAEKIEHPQFKELVKNLEISIRYLADLRAVVHSSRRTLREYQKMSGERKNMLREAGINMVLLLVLSGFVLITVDGLVEVSVWEVLLFSLPGNLALLCLLIIFGMFGAQIYGIYK